MAREEGYPIFVGYGLSTASVLATWRENLVIYAALAVLAGLALYAVTSLALRAVQRENRAQASLLGEMRRREAAEATLRRCDAATLRQEQKMEAIGQLTGGIAHDFNNLLAAILGNLELLAKRLPDDPRLRRYVAGALEGSRRGAGLTRRMLAFARRQDLKLERVEVPRLIQDMSEFIERTIGPTIAIATHKHLQQGIESDHFRVKKNMARIGGFQSFNIARRTIQEFEAMLWMRKGFGFTGAWTVREQNRLLGFYFGLPEVNEV